MSSNSNNIPFTDALNVALRLLEGLDSPRALSVFLLADSYLVKSYQPDAFARELDCLTVNPAHYDASIDNHSFMIDYQATCLLTKIPPKPGHDSTSLSTRAIEAFKESEENNLITNTNWSLSNEFNNAYQAFTSLGLDLNDLRSIVSTLLGRAPSVPTLIKNMSWSGGATAMLSRARSCPEEKCQLEIGITYNLAKAMAPYVEFLPRSIQHTWRLIPGNQVSTVPKNMKTDRSIAMEPGINASFQRCIGKCISKRLLKAGIDLRDQSNNQQVCAEAEKMGLSTLDFRNASNSICLFPLLSILPADWAHLIEISRSAHGTFDSRAQILEGNATWFEYNMLSSMGNGYTFEVETLLFFAIALWIGCEQSQTWVYGDDVIIPHEMVAQYTSVCKVFGLALNMEKSFITGTFFESCGMFTFAGRDVTPLKIKELLNGPKDIIILANKLRVFANLLGHNNYCDRRCLPAWRDCIDRLSPGIRRKCRGPVGSGLTLFCNLDEVNTRYSRSRAGLSFLTLRPEIDYKSADHDGLLAWRLYQLESHDSNIFSEDIATRGNFILPRVKRYVTAVSYFEGS